MPKVKNNKSKISKKEIIRTHEFNKISIFLNSDKATLLHKAKRNKVNLKSKTNQKFQK